MQTVYDLIAQVSKSDTTVLIRGESGTGKELVAHAIHFNSLRSAKPFIKVNCGALPESVVESELFGHEKRVHGSNSDKKRPLRTRPRWTIFLDEIGDLSPTTQIKLLRVLQEREFERVGGTATLKTDVRVIAATNRDLEDLISEGKFRQTSTTAWTCSLFTFRPSEIARPIYRCLPTFLWKNTARSTTRTSAGLLRRP